MSIDFTNALPVVSAARKLIMQVPNGPVVTFPKGAAISTYGQNNDAPVIVVCNRTDTTQGPEGTWQGADATNGIVIVNEVPEDAANMALNILESGHTIIALNTAVVFLEEKGYIDQYTTKKSFVDTKLSPAGRMLDAYTGIVKRDDRDVSRIVRDADGIIWRKMGDSVHHIEPDILVRTYVKADGSAIDLAEIPQV